MKSFKKRILAGLTAGTLLFTGFAGSVYAAERPDAPPPGKAQKIDSDTLAKEIAQQYDVNEKEVLAALKENKPLDDVYYAAIFAKASGKSFRQVFAMKSDWFDVMKALGITREKYDATVRELMAKDIAARSELDIKTVEKLMDKHYRPRDIRIAGRLAKASGKDVQSILDMKKINQRWFDVAKELGVNPEVTRPRSPADEAEDAEQEQPEQPREQPAE